MYPPFFEGTCEPGEEFSKAAKTRFFKVVKREIEFARRHNVKVALESFCYCPSILSFQNGASGAGGWKPLSPSWTFG